MHALVTGGQGYIGNHLTKYLLDHGHKVTTLDSGFDRKPFNLEGYKGSLRRVETTILNPDGVCRAMDGVDVVFHLAARMDWNPSFRHPARMIQCNVDGACIVFSMAQRMGIERVVFTSSAAVYGNLINATEDSPCMPVNLYGCSKLAAEAVCREFFNQGLEVIILRLYNVWGRCNSKSVVSKFSQGNIKIMGDGSQTRDFVFIDDVIQAFIHSTQWDSGIYNIGTGDEIEINGLFKMMSDCTPFYENYPRGYQEPYRSCSDQSFTKKNTGWEPKIRLGNLDRLGLLELCR